MKSILTAKKIIIIDDEPLITDLVADLLRQIGALVETTNDSSVALSLIRSHMPDCIILDRHMPKLDGLEVLKKLKADHVCRSIPVVMLTAANKEGEIRDALKAGAIGYVIKPFKASILVKQIEKIIEVKKNIWYV